MSSRNNILNALKKATEGVSAERPSVPNDADIFADIPGGDLSQTFAERLAELSGEPFIVASEDEATTKLKELVENKRICATKSLEPLLKDLAISWLDDGVSKAALAEFDVVVTGADALVARTGTVIVNSECVGRRSAFLVPFHIVITSADKLVPSLEQAMTSENMGRSTVLISGPARTADIEKILVLGAHGPKRLAVIILM